MKFTEWNATILNDDSTSCDEFYKTEMDVFAIYRNHIILSRRIKFSTFLLVRLKQ